MSINHINNGEAGNSVRSKLNEVITTINTGLGANTILNGIGVPNNALGKDGDFYLNTTNLNFYGPKSAGVWGGFVTLGGADGQDGVDGTNGINGANGLDGKTVLNGTTTPSTALGVDGDFYIRTTDYFLFGPKSGGVWGSGISLVGAAGTNGTNGVDGVLGFGLRYTFGMATTPTPASGELRFNNASYASVTQVFVSETDRLSNNLGALLDSISNGSPLLVLDDTDPTAYAYFTLNSQTDNGADRTFSVTHIASGGTISGSVSLTFAARGEEGLSGTNGTDGRTILSGSGTPSSGLGVAGDFYIDTAAKTIYGPKAAGVWGSATPLVGATGSIESTSSVTLNTISTPLSPSAGTSLFYLKPDDGIYQQNSSGVELLLGPLPFEVIYEATGLAGETTEDFILELGTSGIITNISLSNPSWLVAYVDEDSRTADASRLITEDPEPGSGILLEVVAESIADILITPSVNYWSSGSVFFMVKNTEVSPLDISIIIKGVRFS